MAQSFFIRAKKVSFNSLPILKTMEGTFFSSTWSVFPNKNRIIASANTVGIIKVKDKRIVGAILPFVLAAALIAVSMWIKGICTLKM